MPSDWILESAVLLFALVGLRAGSITIAEETLRIGQYGRAHHKNASNWRKASESGEAKFLSPACLPIPPRAHLRRFCRSITRLSFGAGSDLTGLLPEAFSLRRAGCQVACGCKRRGCGRPSARRASGSRPAQGQRSQRMCGCLRLPIIHPHARSSGRESAPILTGPGLSRLTSAATDS